MFIDYPNVFITSATYCISYLTRFALQHSVDGNK